MDSKNYKRTSREVSDQTRQKISQALKGRTHSLETRKKISDGQKAAWSRIPQKQTTDILWGTSEDNKRETKN